MELDLGLALSSTNHFVSTPKLKEMDLISHVNYQVNHDYGDDNSTLSSQSSVNNHDDDDDEDDGSICYVDHHGMKRRCFEVESFDFGNKTLPLLVWDKEPNQHDEEPYSLCNSSSFAFNKNEEDEIVGWPPIKSRRKNKQCQQNDAQQHHHQLLSRGRCFPVGENGGGCGGFGSMYVKVQMEGCFITRKIDLKLYQSYQSLTSTLLALFGKGQDSVESYKLTYQDKDGDWFLVGDIPWSTFIGSVQRLKLRRREDRI